MVCQVISAVKKSRKGRIENTPGGKRLQFKTGKSGLQRRGHLCDRMEKAFWAEVQKS